MRKSRTLRLRRKLWIDAVGFGGFGARAPCHWCRRRLKWREATVDHEPPRCKGGEFEDAVLACFECNQRRNHLMQLEDELRNMMNIMDIKNGRVTINGVSFDVPPGSSVSIVNGVLTVNGKVMDGQLSGVVKVVVEGALVSLQTDASVECGEVTGSVKCGGSVRCDAVKGNVSCGGSVKCEDVGGSVTCGGSVHRK